MARQWCLSSVTFVHPTQTVKLFGNIFTGFCILGIWGGSCKISRRSAQENPSTGALNTRWVGETGMQYPCFTCFTVASHYCINRPYTASLLSTTDHLTIDLSAGETPVRIVAGTHPWIVCRIMGEIV